MRIVQAPRFHLSAGLCPVRNSSLCGCGDWIFGYHTPSLGPCRLKMSTPLYSRSLFLPGPMAPQTHLGITLQRHCVLSGLRYTLYQLGFEIPEKSPVRIFQLRLYLDAEGLEGRLEGTPGADEIFGALIQPGGRLDLTEQAGEVAAAAMFHRLRLTAVRRRRTAKLGEPADGATAWKLFRAGVSRWLVRLNDAFLTETLSARSRRRRRAEEKPTEPTLPREAWRFRSGKSCKLDRLGPADLFAPSWSEDRDARDQARGLLAEEPVPSRDPRRGVFRETYRAMLSNLRPAYLALAETACERGVLDDPEDAFFIPFDLVGDLADSHRPSWLEEAVASNRAEYEACLSSVDPGDELDGVPTVVLDEGKTAEQAWNCLWPLP